MPFQIALPIFEGPLDLLLYLIKENKIDIYDIPISLITKQYLESLDLMKELDIEIASEFLIMAANLIYIKSKMLLPKPEQIEEEEDPRLELVEQLVEHMKFKEVSKFLNERYRVWSKAFTRKTSKEEEFYFEEISVFDLLTVLKRLIQKKEPKIVITKETIRVEDKIEEIMKMLRERKTLIFEEIFENTLNNRNVNKLEVIITFLAILELLRLRVIKAFQEIPFSKIFINLEEGNGSRYNF